MLRNFIKSQKLKSVTPNLYRHIVAQSRQAVFYTDYNVGDDFEGRFNMLSLHMIMVLDRLQKEGDGGEMLGQQLVDHFFDDLDGVVREMGTGDMGVSHKIKKLANRFYGRMKIYQEGLEKADDSLRDALWRNVYPKRVDDGQGDASKLADYMVETSARLGNVSLDVFEKGGAVFGKG